MAHEKRKTLPSQDRQTIDADLRKAGMVNAICIDDATERTGNCGIAAVGRANVSLDNDSFFRFPQGINSKMQLRVAFATDGAVIGGSLR